jgi:hypothetical protein
LDFIDPDQYDPAAHSYTAMVAEGSNPKLGFRMLHLLRFEADALNTDVTIANDSTKLTYTVDIASSDSISLPPDHPNIVVDWSHGLTRNALGNPWIPERISRVSVAHYPEMNARDLEGNFLEIEDIASEVYTTLVRSGYSVNLNTLVDEAGVSFTGITHQGTWIVALVCGDCTNPAPWFLSVLQPGTPG